MRQCLFVYHYWIDPVFGFMSARLQTWFPFTLYVYMNGREWLARQMDREGLKYQRQDNCFSWIDDFTRAQSLMDEQLKTDWASALNGCVERIHPLFPELCEKYPMNYYWTSFQSEWAMDIVFRDPRQLQHLYPQLIHLGMVSFSSPDVMRFMDKKVNRKGDAVSPNAHEVVSDLKIRREGVRIKHRLGKNSIKLYDKAYCEGGAVLRAELTLKCCRTVLGLPPQNRPDRRRTAVVDDTTTLGELVAQLERRVRWNQYWVRALHPFEPGDLALLTAVNRGEFVINGLRNRDLQALLYSTAPTTKQEARRRSAAISRKLRLLRAHGIIHKLPNTRRYQVTEQGRLALNAILSAQRTTTQMLTTLAA